MCSAEVAHAHAVSPQAGAFYAGFLHPLTAPEHLLPMIALGLLAGQQGIQKGQGMLLAFIAALALGAGFAGWQPALTDVALMNLGSLVVLGGLVAADWRLPVAGGYALALLLGVTHGYANGAALPANLSPAVFTLGLAGAALLTAGYGLAAADWAQRLQLAWPRVAVRVAGSWIAAAGILALSVLHRVQ